MLFNPVGILLITILLIVFATVVYSGRTSQADRWRKIPVSNVQKERIARQIATGYGGGPFKPSLDMKEHVDFFLTPAFLVQEAISDDVIITYPTE